jgi:hypothetical protein
VHALSVRRSEDCLKYVGVFASTTAARLIDFSPATVSTLVTAGVDDFFFEQEVAPDTRMRVLASVIVLASEEGIRFIRISFVMSYWMALNQSHEYQDSSRIHASLYARYITLGIGRVSVFHAMLRALKLCPRGGDGPWC